MGQSLPIACSLGAADLKARVAEIRHLGADGLVDSEVEDGRAVLRFRPDPGIRQRVEAIVVAESECCAFLDFGVEHRPDGTVVTISAPDGGGEVVRELAGAFAGR
jgi:hypothetical protein